jgi:hypothetical protein
MEKKIALFILIFTSHRYPITPTIEEEKKFMKPTLTLCFKQPETDFFPKDTYSDNIKNYYKSDKSPANCKKALVFYQIILQGQIKNLEDQINNQEQTNKTQENINHRTNQYLINEQRRRTIEFIFNNMLRPVILSNSIDYINQALELDSKHFNKMYSELNKTYLEDNNTTATIEYISKSMFFYSLFKPLMHIRD